MAAQHFDLVGLEVIVKAKRPANLMLLQSFCGRVNEWIRQNHVVQVELESIRVVVIVIKDGSGCVREVLARKAFAGEDELSRLVNGEFFVE